MGALLLLLSLLRFRQLRIHRIQQFSQEFSALNVIHEQHFLCAGKRQQIRTALCLRKWGNRMCLYQKTGRAAEVETQTVVMKWREQKISHPHKVGRRAKTCRPFCVSSYSIARACARVKSALFQVNEIHKKTNHFPGSQRPHSAALRLQYLRRTGTDGDPFASINARARAIKGRVKNEKSFFTRPLYV